MKSKIIELHERKKKVLEINKGDVIDSERYDYILNTARGLSLALKYIDESPCDPDIYPEQLKAWNQLKKWREKK